MSVVQIAAGGLCDGLYMLGPGSGTIWRCGLVRVGVTMGVGFKTFTLAA